MQSFLAMITLIDGNVPIPTPPIYYPPPGQLPGTPPGYPSHPIYNPPYPSTGPGFPTHPIAPGGPPPYPDQGLPGGQPHPSHPIVIPPGSMGPGVPTHPIIIPQPPLVPTHPIVIPPDTAGPGVPSHPIVIPPPTSPGVPTHPIAPGGPPPGIWPSPGVPTHPIVLPPVPPAAADDKALVFVKTAGQDGVWFIIDKNDGLKPTHPTPKTPKPAA
jgi:hypothetical protein